MARTKQLKDVSNASGLQQVRRVAVLIAGGLTVLAGLAMLILPGPAFLVIPAGIAILATEFRWARHLAGVVRDVLKRTTSKKKLKAMIHANSLSLTLFLLFLLFLAGQVLCGHHSDSHERVLRGEPQQSFFAYLLSGQCIEATFENWESEFLQMGAFVLLTMCLHQKGAADSKKLDGHERRGEMEPRKNSPWPVRRGGWIAGIYASSLSLGLLGLFGISFLLHAVGGAEEFNEDQAYYGIPPVSVLGYLVTSRFWFESFQNWQSEFLSVGILLVLSIFLRQKGSPESKPVNAPNWETG